MEIQAAEINI